jgi:hypothetical protein
MYLNIHLHTFTHIHDLQVRHPCVEELLGLGRYVASDLRLGAAQTADSANSADGAEGAEGAAADGSVGAGKVSIITGPNMVSSAMNYDMLFFDCNIIRCIITVREEEESKRKIDCKRL